MSSGGMLLLLMTIIGFFTSILNVVDGHVLNKTNYTNNKQTKLRYYKNKDLLYILSVVSIPYLFIVIGGGLGGRLDSTKIKLISAQLSLH